MSKKHKYLVSVALNTRSLGSTFKNISVEYEKPITAYDIHIIEKNMCAKYHYGEAVVISFSKFENTPS